MDEYKTLRRALRELAEAVTREFELDRAMAWMLRALARVAAWVIVVVVWLRHLWEEENSSAQQDM